MQDCPYNTPLGIAFLEAGQEMGYDVRDINGEKQTGFALWQMTMRRGTRYFYHLLELGRRNLSDLKIVPNWKLSGKEIKLSAFPSLVNNLFVILLVSSVHWQV